MKILAIIPAKGDSKRLKRKNIYPILNQPMIKYSIDACKESSYKIDVIVSSEDDEIIQICKQYNIKKVVKRDEALCGDVPKMRVIQDVASHCNINQYDAIISLQANSPEIKYYHLDQALDLFFDKNLCEVISVDGELIQNAAFRIMRPEYVNWDSHSVHIGCYVCDVRDVHDIYDVHEVEWRLKNGNRGYRWMRWNFYRSLFRKIWE